MTMRMRLVLAVLVVGWLQVHVVVVMGDVGTATAYSPHLSTRCPGYDTERFPEDGFFAAASYGVWDNGAACGRKYQMHCLSGLGNPCKTNTIVVEIIDYCRDPCPWTLVLSNKAFEAISRIPNTTVNIEFAQI